MRTVADFQVINSLVAVDEDDWGWWAVVDGDEEVTGKRMVSLEAVWRW